MKIKIGQDRGTREARDAERVRLAREAVGPDTALFVDANGAYTAQQAVRVGDSLREWGITWFEEPVSSEDLAGLRFVRERTQAGVAAAHGLGFSGHCAPAISAAPAAAAAGLRHLEWFHDHVRLEAMLFDGTLDPTGGTISPRADLPGNGLSLRDADAGRFRVA